MGIFADIVEKLKSILSDDREEGQPQNTVPSEKAAERLDAMAVGPKEGLKWRFSVVDLLKLLGFESDFASREQLAKDLGITNYSGTATDNTEMHQKLLEAFEKNDIRLPR